MAIGQEEMEVVVKRLDVIDKRLQDVQDKLRRSADQSGQRQALMHSVVDQLSSILLEVQNDIRELLEALKEAD